MLHGVRKTTKTENESTNPCTSCSNAVSHAMQSVSMANVPKPEKLNTWPVTAMIAPAKSAKEYGNGQPL
jgi:hypothetical protein